MSMSLFTMSVLTHLILMTLSAPSVDKDTGELAWCHIAEEYQDPESSPDERVPEPGVLITAP